MPSIGLVDGGLRLPVEHPLHMGDLARIGDDVDARDQMIVTLRARTEARAPPTKATTLGSPLIVWAANRFPEAAPKNCMTRSATSSRPMFGRLTPGRDLPPPRSPPPTTE